MTPTTMHPDDFRMYCDNYAGLCRNCGEITESGCEPDADGVLCECCSEHAVVGFEDALIEGLIVLADEDEPVPAAPASSPHPLRPWHDLVDPTDTGVPEPGVHLVHRGNAMTVVHALGPRQPISGGGFSQTTSRLEGSDTLIADVPDGVLAIDTREVGLEAAWDYVWRGPYTDVKLPRWGIDDNDPPMTGYPRSVGVDLAAAVALRAGIPVGVVWKGALHHPSISITTDKPVAWTMSSKPTTHGPAVQAAAAFANRDFEPEFLRALVLAIRNPGTRVDLRLVDSVVTITATLMSGKER